MKRAEKVLAALLGSVLLGCSSPAKEPPAPPEPPPVEREITSFDNTTAPYNERVGVTNWGALYMPGLGQNEYSLLKGAQTLRSLGTKVIKVAAGDPVAQYPLDDFSNLDASECADMLKHETYKKLFAMDFSTFFISITEKARVSYADGVSEEEAAKVENEFYNATKYLLETYRGSGKTFILQNWETDNYVAYSVSGNNAAQVFRNYADYFNARQNGINRARDEFVMSEQKNVYVFGALEINRLNTSAAVRAVDYTVPYTYADLYTYSSYEYKDKGVVTDALDVAQKLSAALAYYKSKLPPASAYPQTVYFGDKRLAFTEFGYPDKADGYGGAWQKIVAQGHLLAMRVSNLQYAVYWQLCCNEASGNNAAAIKKLKGRDLRAYEWQEGDINGFYLIRPDGATTQTYTYLQTVFEQNTLG